MNEYKMDATELSMQMTFLVRSGKLAPKDCLFVNKLIKQLNKQKNNVSRKVLRSVQSKFEEIQNRYQR